MTSESILEIEGFERVIGDLVESFCRPGHEINDGGVIDKTWVHSSIISEVIACFTHEEDDMEIILYSGIELIEKNLIFDIFIFTLFTLISHHSSYYFLHFLFDSWHVFFPE